MFRIQVSGRRVPVLMAAMMAITSIAGAADDTTEVGPASVSASVSATSSPQNEEIAGLRAALAEQQKQLEALQRTMQQQQQLLEKAIGQGDASAPALRGSLGQVASITPIIPVSPALAAAAPVIPVPQAGSSSSTDAKIDGLQKAVDSINSKLGGFKLSGDFRYRLDMQLRHGDNIAAPLQNVRGRYRVRLNVDKDIVPGLTAHAQLSTGPFSNETTNDQDFAGFAAKAPFSLAEAWVRYAKGNWSVRGGRMEEVFADNQRFIWDDDVRFNGFETRYTVPFNKSVGLEFRVGEYILTNPNVQILGGTTTVSPGTTAITNPLVQAGYKIGGKVRDTTLLHPGFILRAKTGKWANQIYGDFQYWRNANQIQAASVYSGTQDGGQLLVNPAIGIFLPGSIGQSGNATTTSGGSIYWARYFQIVKGGFRTDYADMKWGRLSMPFWFDFQASGNVGTSSDKKAFMASVNFGQIRKFGDMRFLYQYSYKQANSMISQFTDDDLGTQVGVNSKVNTVRFDLGLTRFLQWQNILFIQDPITSNRPGFFVPLQVGANTTFRFLGQLAFTY